MNILVTGGLGFIGSHTVVELIKNNHTVIIVDNLINSKIEVLDKLNQITGTKPTFYHIDVTDEAKVEEIFNNHEIDGVIHYTQKFCHRALDNIVLKEKLPYPLINIESDREHKLDERTKIRLDAFIEMLKEY